MLAKVHSAGIAGINGYIITTEVDISKGLPSFDIVGLPDTAVRESKERVRAALKNCGFTVPSGRVTVNLAPADMKKEGPYYDLPITAAILLATEQINFQKDEYMFIGELSLDGQIRPVKGILPMVIAARDNGIRNVILPKENEREAAVTEGINVYGASSLSDIIGHFSGTSVIEPVKIDIKEIFDNASKLATLDFSEVKGQQNVKRAIEVAVSGNHNILMIGSPGSGKSMIAKRIPTILPELTLEEALETTKIHSVAGLLSASSSLITTRPFRSPHHGISAPGLVGGGSNPKPGELSLAHNGVLFLDELPEFSKDSLESMRQPLEDGTVTISRVNSSYTYPCNVLFVASMNPCPCGYYGDATRECKCTPPQIARYLGRISGPLLDRIDIHTEVSSVKYDELDSNTTEESSAIIRQRVDDARKIQKERYKDLGIYSNSELSPSQIREFCNVGAEGRKLLKMAFENLGLSARAHDRILKVARTIADLDGSVSVETEHIAEAIQYRSLDRKYWA